MKACEEVSYNTSAGKVSLAEAKSYNITILQGPGKHSNQWTVCLEILALEKLKNSLTKNLTCITFKKCERLTL